MVFSRTNKSSPHRDLLIRTSAWTTVAIAFVCISCGLGGVADAVVLSGPGSFTGHNLITFDTNSRDTSEGNVIEVGWPYNFSVDPPSGLNGFFGHSSGRLLAAGSPYSLDTEWFTFSTPLPDKYIERVGFSLYAGGLKNWDITAYHNNIVLETQSVSAADSVVFAGFQSRVGITKVVIAATGPLQDGYNVWATFADDVYFDIADSRCDVTPMITPDYSTSFSRDGVAPELLVAMDKLQASISTISGAEFVPDSGLRTAEQQAHLYEIKTKFQALLEEGVQATRAIVDGKLRPQLAAVTPGSEAEHCQSILDQVNTQIRMHDLGGFSPDGSPAVGKRSNHQAGPDGLGHAIDVAVSGVTDTVIDFLAAQAGLRRPYPDPNSKTYDPGHFELLGEPPVKQAKIIGNSPINIMVTDPDGRRIGWDPIEQKYVNEIDPLASYSGDGTEPQEIYFPIYSILDGQYTVTGVGTGDGPYSVTLQTWEGEYEPETYLVNRVIGAGIAAAGMPLNAITAQLSAVPGDYDHNGHIDGADILLWQQSFGSSMDLAADGNGNGTVDAADYVVWRDALSNTAGSNSLVDRTVPEPATLATLIVGLLAVFAIRHERML